MTKIFVNSIINFFRSHNFNNKFTKKYIKKRMKHIRYKKALQQK